jgi:uncharacterized membrane protein YgaE (UPF0421/DUF939 family)
MPNDDGPKIEEARPATASPDHFDAFAGSAKAAVSAILAVLCCHWLHFPQAAWAAVSAVIVTQPGLHPSLRASLMRVIANLIGAFVGAVVSSLGGHSLWALGCGILLTGLMCHLARAGEALRPAFAAVVIVIFTNGAGAWEESMQRVLAVVTGCVAALAVGLMSDKITLKPKRLCADGAKSERAPTE